MATNFLSHYLAGYVPNCTNIYSLDEEEEYLLLEDGQLHHLGYGHTLLYCVEKSINKKGHLHNLVFKCEDLFEELLTGTDLACSIHNRTFHIIFTVLGIISLFFLLITFVVYVSIPGLFNLHGKIVVSNVTSIFCVTVYILTVYNVTLTSSVFCVLIGYFGYFVSISMFCWMTVICLDLYWTFGRSLIPVEGFTTSKFFIFSLGSWGVAALFTALVFSADKLLPQDSELKPNVGAAECFIEAEGYKRMVFFHIPILVMMLINLVLYLSTVINLTNHNKQTACARQSIR